MSQSQCSTPKNFSPPRLAARSAGAREHLERQKSGVRIQKPEWIGRKAAFDRFSFLLALVLPDFRFRFYMNDQAFAPLEYDRLRALFRRGAQTPVGRARADALAPLDELPKLRRELSALAE